MKWSGLDARSKDFWALVACSGVQTSWERGVMTACTILFVNILGSGQNIIICARDFHGRRDFSTYVGRIHDTHGLGVFRAFSPRVQNTQQQKTWQNVISFNVSGAISPPI